MFSLRVLVSFCSIFCQFQPGVAYKSDACKKKPVTHFGDSKKIFSLSFFSPTLERKEVSKIAPRLLLRFLRIENKHKYHVL